MEQTLRAKFSPELLNRIDEKIVFDPLKQEEIRKIVDLQVQQLCNRLLQQELTLEVTAAARDEIAREGFDPMYGARPLKRVIQRRLANPLASELLKQARPAGSTITVDFVGEQFVFDS